MVEYYERKFSMWNLFKKEKKIPTVTFATCCWEKDWEKILLDEEYLPKKQIENHGFAFHEKILIINNVSDEEKVSFHAQKLVDKGILTHYYLSRPKASEILQFFQLKRSDFRMGKDAKDYEDVTNDWIYYNALAPLSAIYFSSSDFLLYVTGDVYLEKKVDWIEKAIDKMQKKKKYKVANLTWNERYGEAAKESYKSDENFFISKSGFSDQMFLVLREDFLQPIYGEIREDAAHFPRGDVFEKRVYSFMKNHRWQRITYKLASYVHKSF
jgi:hypothetical protein